MSELKLRQYDRLRRRIDTSWGYLHLSRQETDCGAQKKLLLRASLVCLAALRRVHKWAGNHTPATTVDSLANELAVSIATDFSNEDIYAKVSTILRAVASELTHVNPPGCRRRKVLWILAGVLMCGIFFVLFKAVPGIYREATNYGMRITFYSDNSLQKELAALSKLSVIASDDDYRHSRMNDEDGFTAVWEGYLFAPSNGLYQFFSEHTFSLTIHIDDDTLVENTQNIHWRGSGRHSEASLDEGYHAFRLEHTVPQSPAHIRLKWTGPGIEPNTLVSSPNIIKVLKE